MKKILGLDLGTNSIGWAVVNEAENEGEKSSIVKLGVRTISYDNFVSTATGIKSNDPVKDFTGGKGISCNAGRTQKRSARRTLQRYKLRREHLIQTLKDNHFIDDSTILSENGNKTTFETYRLRAKAANEEISLEEFARVLLMINKKRGYKSSRKAKNTEEGSLIDGMEIAKQLYEQGMTPGQYSLKLLEAGKKHLPDYYRSDLQNEFEKIWNFQRQFYPFLTDEIKEEIENKELNTTWAIFAKACQNAGCAIVGENRKTKGFEKKKENYQWRAKAISAQISLEQLVVVLKDIKGQINSSSGYLGNISDRSKELYFKDLTVGQYQMGKLVENPNYSLKNQVFYRQDYLDEFEKIWETQAKFHKELTPELKKLIRDGGVSPITKTHRCGIFFQRPLKSQKGLISFCEFESKQIEVEVDGKKKIKTVGLRVCPKSSPLFQEFKIWQIINNIQVITENGQKEYLNQEAKEALFDELNYKEKMSKQDVLKFLFKNYKELDLNYEKVDGNHTQAQLFKAYQSIIEQSGHGEHDFSKMCSHDTKKMVEEIFGGLGFNTGILSFDSSLEGVAFEQQPLYRLWHLLYSFEGDKSNLGNESLINKISSEFGFDKEYASIIASISFEQDYGSLSAKAIRKILPHLKDGNDYSVACEYAGYRHSKRSLTKEELAHKVLKDHLDLLPHNSLRNPVVEKILNQMVHVVNGIIDEYGKPDEIRIELARELKKSSQERVEMSEKISENTKLHEEYREILQREPFNLSYVSKNDIIRYKLYKELESNGCKTLYSNTYIPQEELFSKKFDIEHIIPQATLFDDSFSNKTIEARQVNLEKGNMTARDFISSKYGKTELENFENRIEKLYKEKVISKTKYDKLLMTESQIPSGFINRDLRDTQYIAKKAREMLEDIVKFVTPTTGTVTERLREDWQLVDTMQELNWDKYDKLGLTEIKDGRDGQKIRRIKDWTKRNDHRHHAMDALTIAFTKRNYIQYLNNLNARIQKGVDDFVDINNVEVADLNKEDRSSAVYAIEHKELYRDKRGKLRFKPPMPLNDFRAEAKKQLENILISIKAKNKVVTRNINRAKNSVETEIIDHNGKKKKIKGQLTLTPRGQLHEQTVYGKRNFSKISLDNNVTQKQIDLIIDQKIKTYLLSVIKEKGSIKKAFSKENIDNIVFNGVPLKYIFISAPCYTQRIDVENFFTDPQKTTSAKERAIEKILDLGVQRVIENRYQEFGKDFKKAFSNLEDNPIWLNKEKGIAIKRVVISGASNAIPLHKEIDKNGKIVLEGNNQAQFKDYVNTGNNHHVAIYRKPILDKTGKQVLENGIPQYEIDERIVSFHEAVQRAIHGLPIIDKQYKKEEGWKFMFSMKDNEFFVFPRYDELGNITFDPLDYNEDWFKNPDNYAKISPNLFRVQSKSKVMYGNKVVRDYIFRHHLESQVSSKISGITYLQFKSLSFAEKILKVRVNHIGQIVSVGEY
jgi:CRISPR-associated endonuclease Csn1